jgi:hypothetical protein
MVVFGAISRSSASDLDDADISGLGGNVRYDVWLSRSTYY